MEDQKSRSNPVPNDNHLLRTLPENPKVVYDLQSNDVSKLESLEQAPQGPAANLNSESGSGPKTSSTVNNPKRRLVSVKELAAIYGITNGSIYALIKAEPDFPYVNVGLKKKFLIDAEEFERWYLARTKKEKHEHFSVPTSIDLQKAFKFSGSTK